MKKSIINEDLRDQILQQTLVEILTELGTLNHPMIKYLVPSLLKSITLTHLERLKTCCTKIMLVGNDWDMHPTREQLEEFTMIVDDEIRKLLKGL
jgi:hypothetical protein